MMLVFWLARIDILNTLKFLSTFFISPDKTRTFMTPVFKGDTGEEFGVASVTVPVDDICTLSDKVSSIEQNTPPSIFEKALMRLCTKYNALLPPGLKKGGKKTRKNHR